MTTKPDPRTIPIAVASDEEFADMVLNSANKRLRDWLWGKVKEVTDDEIEVSHRLWTSIRERLGLTDEMSLTVNHFSREVLASPADVERFGLTPIAKATEPPQVES